LLLMVVVVITAGSVVVVVIIVIVVTSITPIGMHTAAAWVITASALHLRTN
jgi:hypothetical protein